MLKYRNQPVVVDGIRFASKAEARRYGELKLLERAGKIARLQCQPQFPIKINGALICTYVGDFAYYRISNDINVVEDVKGVETPVFRIKRKLVEAMFPNIVIDVIKK